MEFTRLGPGIRPKMRDAMTEVRNYLFPPQGDVFYVSKRGASGDGKSWTKSFLTITEGIAALTDNDTLFIGPGNYDEAAPKITLSTVKNVRIFGMGTGMQWGEGSTCWRNVTSAADLFDLTGCQGLEIAGIGFVVADAHDAINFVGLCYSVHIHDCCFTGDVGSGAIAERAIDPGSNGADTYIHDCKFVNFVTAGIVIQSPRSVITHNVFRVPDSGYGIYLGAATSEFIVIADNYFLGGGTSDHGIYYTAWTLNNGLIINNRFAGFAKSVPDNVDNTESAFVWNYESDATGGGVAAIVPNPS